MDLNTAAWVAKDSADLGIPLGVAGEALKVEEIDGVTHYGNGSAEGLLRDLAGTGPCTGCWCTRWTDPRLLPRLTMLAEVTDDAGDLEIYAAAAAGVQSTLDSWQAVANLEALAHRVRQRQDGLDDDLCEWVEEVAKRAEALAEEVEAGLGGDALEVLEQVLLAHSFPQRPWTDLDEGIHTFGLRVPARHERRVTAGLSAWLLEAERGAPLDECDRVALNGRSDPGSGRYLEEVLAAARAEFQRLPGTRTLALQHLVPALGSGSSGMRNLAVRVWGTARSRCGRRAVLACPTHVALALRSPRSCIDLGEREELPPGVEETFLGLWDPSGGGVLRDAAAAWRTALSVSS